MKFIMTPYHLPHQQGEQHAADNDQHTQRGQHILLDPASLQGL
jgi:hypothetical protein